MLRKPILFLLCVALAAFTVLGNDCESGKGCRPWGNTSCRQGGVMELVFLVDSSAGSDNNPTAPAPTEPTTASPASTTTIATTTTTTTTTTTVAPTAALNTTTGAAPGHRGFGAAEDSSDSKTTAYPYCAKVDQLQAFLLNNTGLTFKTATSANLSVYGTGALPHVQIPKNGTYGKVLIYEQNTACKSKGKLGPAIVPMLVLNITFTKGMYYYVPDDSPLPVQVGFVPTCDGDTCLIGHGDVCIGNGNVKNCAKCVENEKELASAGTSVWVSYYGTDSDNRRFTSGSENPVNFRKFAADGVLDTLSNDISDL